jgi:hypothetical protein
LASGNIETVVVAGIAATFGAPEVAPAEPIAAAGAIVTYAPNELLTLTLAVTCRLIEVATPRVQ